MQAVYIFHITYYRNKTHDIHYNAEKSSIYLTRKKFQFYNKNLKKGDAPLTYHKQTGNYSYYREIKKNRSRYNLDLSKTPVCYLLDFRK